MSQKVLDKVKPESALKNKIHNAQSALQIQISKLEGTHKKLQDNHDRIFNKNKGKNKKWAVLLDT